MTISNLGREAVKVDADLVKKLANTLRGLSMDAIQAANSGHPGLPLGAADFAVTLWYYFLRHNPADPKWVGRDRFILSGGHGSMLIYSLLHLSGYELSLDDIKNFRQWGSLTPGHPEVDLTPGVEMTTGPLGQGFATGVGFGLAEKMFAARVNTEDLKAIDGFTYVLTTDGDLMEGVALEAASFAGHHKLGNLIYLYDDNDISLDGPTTLCFQEDTPKKFESMGWQVLSVDGHDPQAVADAIIAAQQETEKPTLICCKTIIGKGSPNKQGTSSCHGSPLGADEVAATKKALGLPEGAFIVPDEDKKVWAARKAELVKLSDEWKAAVAAKPEVAKAIDAFLAREIPADLASKLPVYPAGKGPATRSAGKAALQALASSVPFLVGGSADLSCSTNAIVEDTRITADDFSGRHIFYGVREHAMGSIANGVTQHGAFRCFGSTFLTFSDYMRGAMRLGALMETPSMWVFTHDSIFLGEDGPTHQSVEHVMAMRTIPNFNVIRPADAVETGEAWVAALKSTKTPTALILSRQNLEIFDRSDAEFKATGAVENGAYIFRPEKDAAKLDGIIIGTGSELALCVNAARELEKAGKSVRVVSMPCWELFDAQSDDYKASILPADAYSKTMSVEAGTSIGWGKFAKASVAQDGFGASAPANVLAEKFGFTVANVVEKFNQLG